MAANDKFEGWLGLDKESVNGNMQWGEFEPKKWSEADVDIEVECCGICGSDLHMLKSGWSQTPYPCVVGHEIVGKAVRVGSEVKDIKVGDRVGVGAQARSCLKPDCEECSTGQENYCGNGNVSTYGSIYPNGEGKSYGGYAKHNRTHNRFVVKIPEGLSSTDAAPMLCGGITVFSPLKRNGAGPGKKVGIVGVGGLGHFAVLFARALGADRVVAISRKADKREDALKLGADEYIATDDDKDWEKTHKRSLDLIISTVSSAKMPLTGYLGLLRVHGTYIQVGAPDGGELPPVNAFTLLANGIKLGGSGIGSPDEIKEMLQLAADKKIKPWVQTRPMKDANAAIVDMTAGKARYRYVLQN
ncbi:NADP-dependent alcohol dehydrogenase C [Microdochium trichocladiopsis]|uniref:alcohol dehydrogenase (NADP(+)) n=1 Tax=Microdochium trichocladiopsis TaxID=1682393 RepID=A0A9P8Y0K9_9PEZI|nr:NADP-dependent alcohol dehydrogenase C [Microdochium trichocladiopsis]KAH7024651.1 NADP-dependent alcohol dehydrogenase C [Microdochium trichocladiopsis]